MSDRLGIIGGTGLYSLEGLEVIEKKKVETPFGDPSAELLIGRLGNREIVFLPRHGEKHAILPSEINFRANIWALKKVGVRQVISVSATGSLQEDIHPGDLAIPDQYLDWTKGKRNPSFFGNGLVAHISTAKPACSDLTGQVKQACERIGQKIHHSKTYACVEGPRLGTRAESFFLRGAGCHLVGMTNVPECFIAREAQLCYVTIAVATDYDCWMDDPNEHVSVDQVISRYKKTLSEVQKVLKEVIEAPEASRSCDCGKALEGAILSHEISPENQKILAFLQK